LSRKCGKLDFALSCACYSDNFALLLFIILIIKMSGRKVALKAVKGMEMKASVRGS
jgi:hypothetical protein